MIKWAEYTALHAYSIMTCHAIAANSGKGTSKKANGGLSIGVSNLFAEILAAQ
jgi:hypothetical protein